MPKLPNFTGGFTDSFNIHLGKIDFPFPYWQAIAVVVLIFLLILTLAQVRRHFVNWSFKGAAFGIFFGFLLALILEGFLLIGGRTALTGVLGWKNPPAPLANVLDMGKNKLIQVLGAKTEIPSSYAQNNSSVKGAIEVLQSLNPEDTNTVRSIFCK